MFILLLVLATFQCYGTSTPTIISNVIDAREVLQSGAPITEGPKIRTTFDIVWSCASTLFICTWAAIHPNIPPREGPIRALWRKIKLMIWTLLVPELILIWAFRQWVAAMYIAAYFRDEGWTRAHAHFLIMGGFHYVDDEGEKVLDINEFRRLLGLRDSDGVLAFPTITHDEIRDKARGDFLSKAIAVLQTLWFILQCVARGRQGLALTELELVTLALASLNGAMYFFWWDKPLGVNEPVKLYREGYEPRKKFIAGGQAEHENRIQRIGNPPQRRLFEILVAVLHSMAAWFKDSYKSSISLISFIYRRISSIPSNLNINEFVNDQRGKLHDDIPFVHQLWFIYLPIYWIIWIPIRELAYALRPFFDAEEVPAGASHVPSMYSPDTPDTPVMESIILAIPTIFGALHCIGWSFYFPSRIEQLLWRAGSLAITVIPASPILLLVMVLIDSSIDRLFDFSIVDTITCLIPDIMKDLVIAVAIFFFGASLVAYMAARILLLVLALVLLRRQPESAYYAINWTHFFPHV